MARFAFFEDREPNQKLTRIVAEECAHEIVGEPAHNLATSLHLLDRIAQGDIQPPPDAYLVDADLGGGPEDGATIVRRIRELGLPGLIIGNSASPWNHDLAPVDRDAQKDAFAAMGYLDELSGAQL